MDSANSTVPPVPPESECETRKAEYLLNKQTVEGRWAGALENINQVIAAAEAQALTYPEGSPCRQAFQAFADKIKAKRDHLQGVYDFTMQQLIEVDCNGAWAVTLGHNDNVLGEAQNQIDKLSQLYRDARNKTTALACSGHECTDFDEYEPDPTICSMLKSDAEALYNAAMAKFDEMLAACQVKIDSGGGDNEFRNNWLCIRTDLFALKACFQSNYPPEVSCSHKEWEAKHNRRLGAAQIMFDVANCMSGNIFAT